MSRKLSFIACLLFVVSARIQPLEGQAGPPATAARAHPRVIVVGVNGAEWDIILPLLLRGKRSWTAKAVGARAKSGSWSAGR